MKIRKIILQLVILLFFTIGFTTFAQNDLQTQIIGTWQLVSDTNILTIRFSSDNTLIAQDSSGSVTGTYSFIDDDTIHLDASNGVSQTFQISILGDTLITKMPNSDILFQYKRVAEDSQGENVQGQILFLRGNLQDSNGTTIYLMNDDGSNKTPVTTAPGVYITPAWNPNGTTIAFSQIIGMGTTNPQVDIYTLNLATKEFSRVTSGGRNYSPSWSPDGSQLTYNTEADPMPLSSINITTANFTNTINATNDSDQNTDPRWSPDGRHIVFTKAMGVGIGYELFLLDVATSTQTRLTNGYGNAWLGQNPWSPDGSQLVFSSFRDGDSEIYLMDVESQNIRQLTNNDGIADEQPSWSPDGNRIAFISDRDGGVMHIYVLNVADNSIAQLTNDALPDFSPSWRPQ